MEGARQREGEGEEVLVVGRAADVCSLGNLDGHSSDGHRQRLERD